MGSEHVSALDVATDYAINHLNIGLSGVVQARSFALVQIYPFEDVPKPICYGNRLVSVTT